MESDNRSRAKARDRHGRGIRRPLWSPRFEPGVARVGDFAATVEDAAEYLRTEFPADFENLEVVVRDLPLLHGDLNSVRKYAFRRDTNTVYIYRIPIQRFRASNNQLTEIFRIESYVIEAAAEMIGRDPRFYLGGAEE